MLVACAWSRGYSLVADGPLESNALLALEEALRVDLRLDRLEPREAVRAPDVLLQGDALLFAFCVRKIFRTKRGVVGLERPKRVRLYVVVVRASEDFALRGLRVERGHRGEPTPVDFRLRGGDPSKSARRHCERSMALSSTHWKTRELLAFWPNRIRL